MAIKAENYITKCEACGEEIHHEHEIADYPGADMDDTLFCFGCEEQALEYAKESAIEALPGLIYAKYFIRNWRNGFVRAACIDTLLDERIKMFEELL